MRNRIKILAALSLVAAATMSSCNTLEVTMPRGPQGEQGIQGLAGKDGLSAYELWVASVNDRTISDWTGETAVTDFFKYLKGKDGADGKNGIDGLPGKDGSDGKSAYELWLEYVASGVEDPKNPGEDWDKGKTSVHDFYEFLSGSNGDNGSTPYIGPDGNWWIVVDGEPKDLEVSAQGPKGDKGDQGDQGEKGDPGEKGEKGEKGETGASGSDGLPGATPNIGPDGNWWIGSINTGIPARGEKGDKGDPGADGKNGNDGANGKDGNDGRNGQDGKDGANGLSAYDLWVADVTSAKGLENPGNGVFDVDEYPRWPSDATSVEYFYLYLRGRDGEDGKDGVAPAVAAVDTLYTDRVLKDKYNVAPVIALSKTVGEATSYEYVNPFSGGAAFIVTGPGPVIIPDCEVTFTTMDGATTYTKTSDASGYIYLTRGELPAWYEGAPSAKDDPDDLESGVKPLSFRFGNKNISDPGRIAATCKVPYRVGLEMTLNEGMLWHSYSLAKYEIHRTVEGEAEGERFMQTGALGFHASGYGYMHGVNPIFRYYRNEGAVKRLRDMYGSAGDTTSDVPSASSEDSKLMAYFSTIANLSPGEVPSYSRSLSSESTREVSFGDGSSPSVVNVYDTFTYLNKGKLNVRRYRPDYGLYVKDATRKIHVPSLTKLPDTVLNASYVWKNGHTTLVFELDWDAIDALEVADGRKGSWIDGVYTYPYVPFAEMAYRSGTSFSSFNAKGRFNGSAIDSKVTIYWKKPVEFTDIYDGFSVSVADVESSFTYFKGLSGSFVYDASQDDEEGNGTATIFGQEIPKSNASTL